MAKAKQVLDVRVSKGITTSQSNEHQRRWTEKGWEQALEKGNYDPSREHLNFEIVSGKVRPVDKSRSIPERMAEILDRRGIKDPNEGLDEPKYRTVVNIIFGGSRDRMRELAFGSQKVNFDKGADNSDVERKRDIERWAKDVYAFVSGRYGESGKVGVAHGAELCKGTQGKLAHFTVHIGQRTRHFPDKLPARIGDVDADKICFLNGKSVHAHTSIS